MTSWARGTTANSLCSLITIFCWESTDYNLLFKGEEQVEICFIAYHEWIAKPIVVYNSCLSYFSVRCSENYTTLKTKGTKPSVVYLFSLKISIFHWHSKCITIGLLTTTMHCNWPQFNWIKEVNNTAPVQWDMTLCFDEVSTSQHIRNVYCKLQANIFQKYFLSSGITFHQI